MVINDKEDWRKYQKVLGVYNYQGMWRQIRRLTPILGVYMLLFYIYVGEKYDQVGKSLTCKR